MGRLLKLIFGLSALWIVGGFFIAWLELDGGGRRPVPPTSGAAPLVEVGALATPPAEALGRVRRPLPPVSMADPLLLVELEDVAPGMVSTGTAFAAWVRGL